MDVINRHFLLDEIDGKLKRLKECDINLVKDEKMRRDGSNIPLSLKTITEPYLILFYYNSTDIFILKRWKEIAENEIKIDYEAGDKINVGFVNLDYENKILQTFRNVPRSNPFYWAKLKKENSNYFVIFYYKTFPQYYYNGYINSFLIEQDFENWEDKLKNTEDEKNNKFKNISDKFVGDDSLYKVIEDKKLIDNRGNLFTLKKNEIYKITEGIGTSIGVCGPFNFYNYKLKSEFSDKNYEGEFYDFDTYMKKIESDKTTKVNKKDIQLELDFFKDTDHKDFTDLFFDLTSGDFTIS
jgi:hypothetical protein